MASRITRPRYRRLTSLQMNRREAALEAAYKEKDIEVVADVAALEVSRVPDVITVATLSQACVVDIVVPVSDPQAVNRVVKVHNASADTIQLTLNGGTGATALAAGKTGEYLISDTSAGAQTTPVILFVQA